MSEELDLINRQELYNQIRLYLNRSRLGEITSWETLTVGEIAGIIADMKKVKEKCGKWIFEGYLPSWERRCSECGGVVYLVEKINYNYCPYCGVKMEDKEYE